MKFGDTLRGLLRRWYILFPGLLLVAAVAAGTWYTTPPGYSRSATQLLIPGEDSVPEGGNPYLYLGGLAPAADVLVRAIGSENVLNEVVEEHPGIEVEILRDTTTAGPIILIGVTASSDAAAEDVLTMLIKRTAIVLDEFQEMEDIPEDNRMTVISVTVDEQSVLEQRSRLITVTGVAALGTVLIVLVTALIDGSILRRRARKAARKSEQNGSGAAGLLKAGGEATTVSTAEDASATKKSPADQSDGENVAAVPPVRIEQ